MADFSFPQNQSRMEPATGLLVRSILVNGQYLLCSNCSLNPTQDMEQIWLIQGGPGAAIADIGAKWITGQISVPVRVDREGNLEPGIIEILNNSDTPTRPVRIDTNHVLSHNGTLTAYDGGTDDNELVSLDTCLIKECVISAEKGKGVSLIVSIEGMIELRNPSALISPPDNYLEKRQIAWSECDASRGESDMRMVEEVKITFKNNTTLKKFITPFDPNNPYYSHQQDQVNVIGVHGVQREGSFKEIMRLGVEKETYIHGGFMVGENLVLKFGPFSVTIFCPLFKISQQQYTPSILYRNTEFLAQISPIVDDFHKMISYGP